MNRPNTSRPFNTQSTSRDKPATNPRPFNRSAGKPNGKTSEQRTATRDTSELECYSCHQKGHIASSPKCPNFQQRQNRPRFTLMKRTTKMPTKRMMNMQTLGGGSQYDPEEEEHNSEKQLEYLEVEDTPEGEGPEGPEEVRLSSMRTIQMFAMRTNAVDDTSSESTDEEPTSSSSILATTNSTRIEPPIPDIEDIIPENRRSTSGDIMPQDDPESEDREEITDPVFIEYRDGLFYCIEEDQQPAEIEAEIQQLGSRV